MAAKHLAWKLARRHKGKLFTLALVVLAATVISAMLAFFMLSSAMSGAVTVILGSEEVCQTQSLGPGGDSGGPGNPNYVGQEPSGAALEDIPANYLPIYKSAAQAEGLDWAIVAGVGKIESDHGRNAVESSAGALGPMQFMPLTWEDKGVDGNGDGQKDINDPEDSIPAGAKYLRELGAPGDYRDALCQYNAGGARQCASYPEDVLAEADRYRAAEGEGGGDDGGGDGRGGGEDDQASGDSRASQAPLRPPGTALAATDALLNNLGHGLDHGLDHVGHGLHSLGPRAAHATQNSWDRVDGNMNLHYEESTQFDSALKRAVDEWNALGTVKVSPSPSPDETDVWISDGDSADTGGHSGGLAISDGRIYMNAPNMTDNSEDQNVGLIAHELGHQLGFDHPPPEASSIMASPPDTAYVTDYDREEYYERHGKPPEGGGDGGQGGGDQGGGQEEGGRAVFPLPTEFLDAYEDDYNADHEGIDVAAPAGTPVSAVVDGRVVEIAGATPDGNTEADGYAVMVEAAYDAGPLREGDRLYYGNLQGPAGVNPGDEVSAGDKLGTTGTSGERPAGLHLGLYDPSGKRAESATGAMNPYPLLEWLAENGGEAGPESPTVAQTECPEEGGGGAGGGPGSGQPGGPGGGKINGSASGKEVVEEAKKYLGTPYVLGGPEDCVPHEAMDCTCLTHHAFKPFGYDLSDAPLAQWEYGEPANGPPQAGDLMIWDDPGDGTGGHAAISLGNGDTVETSDMIHANTATNDTSIAGFWDTPMYLGARRLVGD